MRKNIVLLFGILFWSGCGISTPFAQTSNINQLSNPKRIDAEGTIRVESSNLFGNTKGILENEKGIPMFSLKSIQDDFTVYDRAKVHISGIIVDEKTIPIVVEVYRIDELIPPPPPPKKLLVKNDFGFFSSLPTGWEEEIPSTGKKIIIKNKNGEDMVSIALLQQAEMEMNTEKMKNSEVFTIGNHTAIRSHSPETTQVLLTQPPFLSLYFEGGAEEKFSFYEFLSSISFENIPTITPSPTSGNEKESQSEEKKISPNTLEEQEIPIVLRYFQENLFRIAPVKKAWEIQKITFYEGKKIDIEYTKGNETYRTVFQYHLEENRSVSTEMLAHYIPGITTRWRLITGMEQKISAEPEIFLQNNNNPVRIPEDFTLYIDTAFHFQIAYPKNLYYSSDHEKKEKFLSRVFFANTPANEQNAIIIVEILDGKEEKERESEYGMVVPRDEFTHFAVRSTVPEQIATAREMAKTLRNTSGL